MSDQVIDIYVGHNATWQQHDQIMMGPFYHIIPTETNIRNTFRNTNGSFTVKKPLFIIQRFINYK